MRLRLNQEYRNKIANRMRVHIEAEAYPKREKNILLQGKI